MATLRTTRAVQTVLAAEFTFRFDDTMKDVAGVEKDFGLTNAAATDFVAINLPIGATILSGEVATTEAFDKACTIAVGDEDTPARYLAAASCAAVGRVPLVPTGRLTDGEPVQIRVTPAGSATTGAATVRVLYIIENRVSELIPR